MANHPLINQILPDHKAGQAKGAQPIINFAKISALGRAMRLRDVDGPAVVSSADSETKETSHGD